MGLKRRNPARTRLLTPTLATLAIAPPGAVNEADTPRPRTQISGEERHRKIAEIAYAHAERAGFTSDPLANWLRAEREIDALLAREAS